MNQLLWLLILVLSSAAIAEEPAAAYAGRKVAAVIDEFRAAGEPFAYSTNLVTDELRVLDEPRPGTPLAVVREILLPHGLTIRAELGVYVVVRAPRRLAGPVASATRAAGDARNDIETVVVAASRYEISRELTTSRFSFDQRNIQSMPDIGEDPLRVTQRLPGAAASGASAAAHFRGGEQNEVGIMLNGQWLFDPFHIRDYQSIFSTIDARAIDGVEVYTGGFSARYGDRMSGLVLMNSIDAGETRRNEVGLSVFNTSLLMAGGNSGTDWLFSVRRGNLDLVINPELGEPSYYDVFGAYEFEFSPHARLSVNTLLADDRVKVVLEAEPAEHEQVVSDTRNAQLWLRLDGDWSSTLASSTMLSFVDYGNTRNGTANDPGKMIAAVRDDREVRQYGLRQDWVWSPSEKHRTQWGIQAAYSEAEFRYTGSAEYFELQATYKDQPTGLNRALKADPKGASYALYVTDRWRLSPKAAIEWGLRWDDQTYTDLSSDSQLSPRFSFLLRATDTTELRFSAGRYHQSQPIQSLQVEDGVTRYWPAQRADQFIFGIRHLTENDTALRLEVFHKDVGDVRPRFENLFDPLGIMPELQPDRVRLDPTSATARGVELSADRTEGACSWWATYTWSEVTDRIGDRDVPRSWDQKHAFQGGVSWKREAWEFSAATSIHTGWPTTDLDLVTDGFDADGEALFVAIPGRRNALRHPTFASVDVRLSHRFNVPRGSLLAFVEISNVLNRRNVCCIDWDLGEDAAGNEFLEYSHDYWMPLLPAIGILWEF